MADGASPRQWGARPVARMIFSAPCSRKGWSQEPARVGTLDLSGGPGGSGRGSRGPPEQGPVAAVSDRSPVTPALRGAGATAAPSQAGASSASEQGRGREGRASGLTFSQGEGDGARGRVQGGETREVQPSVGSDACLALALPLLGAPGCREDTWTPLRLSQRLPLSRLLLGPAYAGRVGCRG